MSIHVVDGRVHSRKDDTRWRHSAAVEVVGGAALARTVGARARALGEGGTELERRWFDDRQTRIRWGTHLWTCLLLTALEPRPVLVADPERR